MNTDQGLTAIAGICLVIVSIVTIISLQTRSHATRKRLKVISAGVVLISAINAAIIMFPAITALEHGASLKQAMQMPISDIIESNKLSLKPSDDIPSDIVKLKGSIVVIYQYNCSKCEKIHADLKTAIDNVKKDGYKIYTVTSKSKIGRKLIQTVNPTDAPIAVYVRYSPAKISGLDYNYIPLCNTDRDDNISFNENRWQQLTHRQQNLE